jgi:hypothetical protein
MTVPDLILEDFACGFPRGIGEQKFTRDRTPDSIDSLQSAVQGPKVGDACGRRYDRRVPCARVQAPSKDQPISRVLIMETV